MRGSPGGRPFPALSFLVSGKAVARLSELGSEIGFSVDEGPSANALHAAAGPYDLRLGYASLPSFEERLVARGFAVAAQARGTAAMLSMADKGLFLPYQEKDSAGLALLDARGASLYRASNPSRAYDSFESIPPAIVNALLFIEDRNLLDESEPNRNPAIEARITIARIALGFDGRTALIVRRRRRLILLNFMSATKRCGNEARVNDVPLGISGRN